MSQFMLVFRADANLEKTTSPEEMQASFARWGAWIGELAEQGHDPKGEPLQYNGTTIRGAQKVVSDGPYAELKDIVTGYLLIDVADEATAIEAGKGCPVFDIDGSVEVRQIMSMG